MAKFKVITEESKCKAIWEKYSENRTLWDLWEFRSCFHTKDFKLNFILGAENGKPIGVLPLVSSKSDGSFTYFGDDFPEQNKLLIEDKKNAELFFENCPKDTQIYYISSEEAKYYDFELGDKRYFLNLQKYGNSFDNYLKFFNKKHRKNLNYDLKKLKELNYSIEKNKLQVFDRLIAMNKAMFGKESNFRDKQFASSMKKAANIALIKEMADFVSVSIGSNVEAAGFGVIYNGTYYVLASGRNTKIKNIGKLIISEQIKSAIIHKCKEIDFLSIESSWKELWNFDSEPMYEFKK